eukprot:scaffold31192_cov67-Phaeocystis_antarctica.AAC.7
MGLWLAADLFQFGRTIFEGIFREKESCRVAPMEIRPPGFLASWVAAQELNSLPHTLSDKIEGPGGEESLFCRKSDLTTRVVLKFIQTTKLHTLDLNYCTGLTSQALGWLGECTALQTLTLHGCEGLRSLPERLGECTGLHTLNLERCTGLLSLPERLGECTALQTLDLYSCSGLLSLPGRLGECTALQTLDLYSCSGLLSLPDLSGLAQLKVCYLPNHLQPWKASGYKAISLSKEP